MVGYRADIVTYDKSKGQFIVVLRPTVEHITVNVGFDFSGHEPENMPTPKRISK